GDLSLRCFAVLGAQFPFQRLLESMDRLALLYDLGMFVRELCEQFSQTFLLLTDCLANFLGIADDSERPLHTRQEFVRLNLEGADLQRHRPGGSYGAAPVRRL